MRSRRSPFAELGAAVAVLALCLGLVVDGAVTGVGLWAKGRSDAFVALPASIQTSYVPERSVLLDRRGAPIAYFWDQDRQSVPSSSMSHWVRDAAVAMADRSKDDIRRASASTKPSNSASGSARFTYP